MVPPLNTAPSQTPEMLYLDKILKQCEKALERTSAQEAYQTVDLVENLAPALARYGQLKGLGPKMFPRLCTAFIMTGQLAEKEYDNRLNPNMGKPLMRYLINHKGPQFFIITAEQSMDIDDYASLNRSSRHYFLIQEDLLSPTPPSPRVSSPAPVQQAQIPANLPFQGQLRPGVNWGELYTPEHVIPGNIIPASFLRQYDLARSMQLTDALTSQLGEACAAEAGSMARAVAEKLDAMALRQMLRGSRPPAPEEMDRAALLRLAQRDQHVHRDIGIELTTLRVYVHSYIAHANDFRQLFRDIGRDQAMNRRQGLWSPATQEQPSEFGHIDHRVQRMVRPQSMYPQALRGGGPLLSHPSNSSRPGAGLWPGQLRPGANSPVIAPSLMLGQQPAADARPRRGQFPQPGGPQPGGRGGGRGGGVPAMGPLGTRHSSRPTRNLYGAAGKPDDTVPDEDYTSNF